MDMSKTKNNPKRTGRKIMHVEFDVSLLYTVSNKEFRAYIREAIEMWGGQRHPEDHLFYESVPKNIRIYDKDGK